MRCLPHSCRERFSNTIAGFNPKNHNLILIGQPALLSNLALNVNQDIKAVLLFGHHSPAEPRRYGSVHLPNSTCGWGTISSPGGHRLIVRRQTASCARPGICASCLLDAVVPPKSVDIRNVNRVLISAWRKECDLTDF